jgi:signal transduction histidine kinase
VLLRFSIRQEAESLVENFIRQNSAAVQSSDRVDLVSRLNLFSASRVWKCLSASIDGVPIFVRKNDVCDAGLFRWRTLVTEGPNGRLQIDFTAGPSQGMLGFSIVFMLFQVFSFVFFLLLGRQAELQRMKGELKIAEVARQVAHDIRSPVAALRVIESDLTESSSGSRQILLGAIQRIEEIANSLLELGRAPVDVASSGVDQSTALEAFDTREFCDLVDSIVAEKRVELRNRNEIQIVFRPAAEWSQGRVSLSGSGFRRVLSNLINNAAEAILGAGVVEVRLDGTFTRELRVIVRDSGRGISPDQLPRMMKKGATFGKKGGNGLGLYHARQRVEAWGGRIWIQSQVGAGTEVFLAFPKVEG